MSNKVVTLFNVFRVLTDPNAEPKAEIDSKEKMNGSNNKKDRMVVTFISNRYYYCYYINDKERLKYTRYTY